jgi:ATP-binding cassette, subfamily B, bacterial
LALSIFALPVLTTGHFGLIAPGGAVTLVGALGLVGILASPLRHVAHALELAATAKVARERIAEFLADAEPRAQADPALKPQDGSVQLAGWPLHLQPDRTFAAHAVHGRRVAIIGPPGSGKTALLETLAGLRVAPTVSNAGQAATAAAIWIGHVSLAAVSLERLAEGLAYVAPEHPPMRGTLAKNLRYRLRRASIKEMQRAGATAGWPGELDAESVTQRVRDAGANLSGEERRALTLARALVGEVQLLLIDDIEHCLPAPREDALARLMAHHQGTLIFVTHDSALAQQADDVWDLGTGEVRGGSGASHGAGAKRLHLVSEAA